MKKRNDILLFVQEKATRENNPKGCIDLRDFGALTVDDSLCRWESDYLFYDEDGNMVDDCGHIIYENWQENANMAHFGSARQSTPSQTWRRLSLTGTSFMTHF